MESMHFTAAMSDAGAAKRMTTIARGGAFLALILGLVLFAHGLSNFLGDSYLAVVGIHVAIGLLAILIAYTTLVPALRRAPGASAARLRTTALATAAVLAILLLTGVFLLAGALTVGNSGPVRLAHLVFAFVAIAALVAVGLAARKASQAS